MRDLPIRLLGCRAGSSRDQAISCARLAQLVCKFFYHSYQKLIVSAGIVSRNRLANRPTIEQLAQASGVSVATVDRVLNKRLPVKASTANRVHEAATRIGFHAAGLIGQRLRDDLPAVKLGFLLLKSSQPFYRPFAQELERAVADMPGIRGSGLVDMVTSHDRGEIVVQRPGMATTARFGRDHDAIDIDKC